MNVSIYKAIKTITCITIILFFLVPHVFGQTQNASQSAQPTDTGQILKVSPAIVTINLRKGQTTSYTIKVTNLLTQGLGIHAHIESFYPSDEIGSISLSAQTATNPLLSWTQLTEPDYVIGPNETKDVSIQVTPPITVPHGSYYAVLFLTPIFSRPQTRITVLSNIGVLLEAQAGTINYTALQKRVQIPTFSLPFLSFDPSHVPFSLRIKNNYPMQFSAKPIMTITPFLGKPYTIVFQDKHIFPNTIRKWDEQIPALQSFHLFYTASLAVSIGEGHIILQRKYFVVIPKVVHTWFLVILGAILLAGIYRIRKNIQRAVRLLFFNA